MKPIVAKSADAAVPDSVGRRAIAYLDSASGYRECLPCQDRGQATPYREPHKRPIDIDHLLLVIAPMLIIAVAILALYS